MEVASVPAEAEFGIEQLEETIMVSGEKRSCAIYRHCQQARSRGEKAPEGRVPCSYVFWF